MSQILIQYVTISLEEALRYRDTFKTVLLIFQV